jgi:large subunit ribosomal protein L25
METGELNCEKRAVKPRSVITALRRQGRVPAVLYGPGSPPTPVSVSGSELRERLSARSHTRIVRLKSGVSELDGRHVIFKEVQRAPVSGAVLHADLYEVDLKRAIQVEVPLKFTGRARGVADGGILQPLVRAMTVECLPLEIPEAIEIDVTELGVHDVIHVSAVKVPGNAKPIFDQDYAVVSVLPPTVAEAPTPEAAAVEGVPEEGAPVEGAAAGAAAAPAEGGPKEGAAPAAAAAAGAAKKAEPAAKK